MDTVIDFGAISWLGVLVATIAFFALGAVYYGPLFGKAWMAAVGTTEEEASSSNMSMLFAGTLVLEALAAVGLAAVLGEDPSVGSGAWAGLVIGVLLVATALAVSSLYERRNATIWALNAGYNVIGFVIMGAILGWLQ